MAIFVSSCRGEGGIRICDLAGTEASGTEGLDSACGIVERLMGDRLRGPNGVILSLSRLVGGEDRREVDAEACADEVRCEGDGVRFLVILSG